MKTTKVMLVSLLLTMAMCSVSIAKLDDVLIGNTLYGGKVWLQDGATLASINDAIFGTQIEALAYQSNGCMVIAFAQDGGTVQVRNPDFSLVYSQSGFGTINAMVVNHKDEIIIGVAEPNYPEYGGNLGTVWLRNPDLSFKNEFVNFGGAITALAVQSNDNIVIASDAVYGTLWVFDPNLTTLLDEQVNFTGNTNGHILALAVQSNDNIVMASYPVGSYTDMSEVWIRQGGAVTVGINQIVGFGGPVTGLAVQSNDNIVVASDYANGTVWVSDPGLWTGGVALSQQVGFGPIKAIAIQSNNNIVIGSQYLLDGNDVGLVWVRDPTATGWVAQQVNFGGAITALAVQPQTYLSMDLNRDKYVNFEDFALLAATWTGSFADMASFAQEWLQCTDATNPLCN